MKKKLLFLIPAFVGMSVFAQAQQRVGVNTNAPEATLDIHGNMSIEKTRAIKDEEKYSTLVWDSRDRKIKQINTPSHMFYSLDYRVECTDGGKYSMKNQWVSDFDTKIPYEKFDVMFGRVLPVGIDKQYPQRIDILHVGSTDDSGGTKLDNRYGPNPTVQVMDYPYAEKHGQSTTYKGSYDNKWYLNPVLRKVFWKDTKTKSWHFSLGYVNARPDHMVRVKLLYEWNVQIIAIDKSVSINLPVNKYYSTRTDYACVKENLDSDDCKKIDNTIDLKENPLNQNILVK